MTGTQKCVKTRNALNAKYSQVHGHAHVEKSTTNTQRYQKPCNNVRDKGKTPMTCKE